MYREGDIAGLTPEQTLRLNLFYRLLERAPGAPPVASYEYDGLTQTAIKTSNTLLSQELQTKRLVLKEE